MMNNRPYIIDTTLRDGEQKAGFVIRESDKPRIAALLDAIGVDEIEIGIPAMGPMIRETIAAIDAMPLRCRKTVWCRAKEEDVALAAECHNDAIHVSLPASERLRNVYGISDERLIFIAGDIISMARKSFGYVSVGIQDASRMQSEMLRMICETCRDAGANRIRLADTVGIWTPDHVGACVDEITDIAGDMEVAIHAHNDLGMATANTLAALNHGASSADVTILGIGERAGNASLEQVVTAGALTQGYFRQIEKASLKMLCHSFANMTGLTVPDSQPVVGEGVVRHESGIHVHALLRDAQSYQAFDPEFVGHDGPSFVLGKHSGLAALEHIMNRDGLVPTNGCTMHDILEHVRRCADTEGRVTKECINRVALM